MVIYIKNGVRIKKTKELIIDHPTLVNYVDFLFDAKLFQINGEVVKFLDIHFILNMNTNNYDKNIKNIQTYFKSEEVFTEVEYYGKTIKCICFPEQGCVSWEKNNSYKDNEYTLELYYKNELKYIWIYD